MGGDFGEDGWIFIPLGDAVVVFSPLLIIDDERHNLMSQAFLHHNQPAQAAVAILKGVDAFKANMEIQNLILFDIIFLICVEICNKILKPNTHVLRRYCIG